MDQVLKMFSTTTGDLMDLGPQEDTDLDAMLELGDMMATNRPDVIVHLEPLSLQKWEDS